MQNSGLGWSLLVFLGIGVTPRAPFLDQLKSASSPRNNPTTHISIVIHFLNVPISLCYGSVWPVHWWEKETCGKARDVSSTADSRKGESRSAGMHLL